MEVIRAINVNDAFARGLELIRVQGRSRDSRDGNVFVVHGPVTTFYVNPTQRVLFDPIRDANPFFHFFEALWMLAGRNDVAFVAQFVPRMKEYSDNGTSLHGAYGYRWRFWFGRDQLDAIVGILQKNPNDRRCVLQMWDAPADLGKLGKDFPCNTNAYFSINTFGQLDMTVCCRSNDIIMGAYGANVVHFSMLQEYVAFRIGVPVGSYWQMSNNYHAYHRDMVKFENIERERYVDPYASENMRVFPLYDPREASISEWHEDLEIFMKDGPITGFRNAFFRKVVTPMWYAWKAWKNEGGEDRFSTPVEILQQCKADDWRTAASEWILRRKATWMSKHAS